MFASANGGVYIRVESHLTGHMMSAYSSTARPWAFSIWVSFIHLRVRQMLVQRSPDALHRVSDYAAHDENLDH